MGKIPNCIYNLQLIINREYLEDDINSVDSNFNCTWSGVSATKMGMSVLAMCGGHSLSLFPKN